MDTDKVSRGLTFLFAVIGIGIFYFVLMTKLEVMARQTEAKVHKLSADLAWEDYLYGQALQKTAGQNFSPSSEPVENQHNTNQ